MIKILVIEDSQKDLTLIKEFLALANFEHQFFHSSSLMGAMNLIDKIRMDIVLLDLSLDDSKGFNTLIQYMNKAASIPVIVFTGNKNEVVGIQSVKAGAQDFLVKGEFGHKRLVKSIEYSIQRFKEKADLLKSVQQLAIKQKKGHVIRKIANYATWEMDIVNNKMKWSKELFNLFGLPHHSQTISLTDYLSFVHIHDKEKVELFFESAIKTGQVTHVNHRIVINNTKIRNVALRAQVQYEEMTNKIMLFGSLQDTSKDKTEKTTSKTESTSQLDNKSILDLLAQELDSTNIKDSFSSIRSTLDNLEKAIPNVQANKHWQQLNFEFKILLNQFNKVNNISNYLNITKHEAVKPFSLSELTALTQSTPSLDTNQEVQASSYLLSGQKDIIVQLCLLLHQLFPDSLSQHQLLFNIESDKNDNFLTISLPLQKTCKPLMAIQEALNNKNLSPSADIQKDFNAFLLLELCVKLQANMLLTTKANQHNLKFRIPVELTPNETPTPNTKKKDHSILIIEDHIMVQLSLKRVLVSALGENTKIQLVKTINDANTALSNTHFDFIYLDVHLGDNTTQELMQKLDSKPNIPIIGIISSELTDQIPQLREMGVSHIIKKPFTKASIKEHVRIILGEK